MGNLPRGDANQASADEIAFGSMSGQGHLRQGRASSKSGDVRYAAESGSNFRALAACQRRQDQVEVFLCQQMTLVNLAIYTARESLNASFYCG